MGENIYSAASAYDAAAVTPSDTTHLGNGRGLYVGGTGDVSVVTSKGTTVTFPAVPAGTILPIMVSKVRSTSTTATNIVVFYHF